VAGNRGSGDRPSLVNTLACFDRYERRFAAAMTSIPERKPWTKTGRKDIVRTLRRCLGIRKGWVPEIRSRIARITDCNGFQIEHLTFRSWPDVRGAAHLYVPKPLKQNPGAFVLLCCGHGWDGKLNPMYQAMARHIARRGAIVLVPDNIGQGERAPMGHGEVVVPFACGTSLQGLIVTETLGWIAWAAADGRIDSRRMAAVGNSGGGHLTSLLAPLCPALAVLSSSGRPSTYEFVARKEKKLCHCAIIPRIVGELEMWQTLGCFAPKPLFVFQGQGDPLFPLDLFYAVARKLRSVYRILDAPERFSAEAASGGHSWDSRRREMLGRFLSTNLSLPRRTSVGKRSVEKLLGKNGRCFAEWPEDACGTDELAGRLTGVDAAADIKLWDVFPPDADCTDLAQAERADSRQILAQFEALLKTDTR